MPQPVQSILASLSAGERRELLAALAREHFASEQAAEVEIQGAEGETLGYLTPPGVRICHVLGINPKDMPPELTGPYYSLRQTLEYLERLAPSADPVAAPPSQS